MRGARCRLLGALAGLCLLSGLWGLSCGRVASGPVPLTDERGELRRVIDSMLASAETRSARWGVLIVDPDADDTLYAHDAGKLFVPASNMKIITSAFVLDALGPDFRFATPIIVGGAVRSGVAGDLLIAGRGDPTVSDHVAGDAMIPLRAVADSLWNRGLRRVRGRVLPMGDAFPDANAGFGWEWDDLDFPYAAVVDELLFNEGFSQIHVRGADRPGVAPRAVTSPARTFPRVRVEAMTLSNAIGVDSGSRIQAVNDTVRGDVVIRGTILVGDTVTLEVTHRDPNEAYLGALREALVDRGIPVGDSVLLRSFPMDTLAVLRSPPLSQILAAFLKPSQNQIGEMLFKAVALQRTDTGSARGAARLVVERLRAWGADADGFLVGDGSGLSRHDLVSSATIVRVLDMMRRHAHHQVYYDALAVAGVDGTLRGRMRGTLAEGNVRGKTGTLANVRSLSGYVTTSAGRQLIFSILCNNYLVPTDYVTRVQDSIVVRLARLRVGNGV